MVEWFDSTVLNWFQTIQNPVLTPVLKLFTLIGEAGAVWIAAGILLLARKSSRSAGIAVLLSLVFCLLTGNVLLKNLVARPRPCWRAPDIEMLIAIPRDYSFPSGHTMSSFAAAAGVYIWNKKWGIAALAGAVIIAASRLYFYVHYPTDILAGALIGIFLAMVSKWMIDKVTTYNAKKGGNHENKKQGKI